MFVGVTWRLTAKFPGVPGMSSDRIAGAAAPAVVPPTTEPDERGLLKHNKDVDWRTFGSEAYWEHNYRYLRDDDREIIDTVADFFSDRLASVKAGTLRGLDVGSGANLYPALSMLPWCRIVTLTDVGEQNLHWLTRTARGSGIDNEQGSWLWQDFWDAYATRPGYDEVANPRVELREHHEVRELSVKDLPEHRWDLGTMFFVAESMTNYENEFEEAVERFMLALERGAPFAAAFMDSSMGYLVGSESFPAVREVDHERVTAVLSKYSGKFNVKSIEVPALDPLRDGYKGMIIATGTTTGS